MQPAHASSCLCECELHAGAFRCSTTLTRWTRDDGDSTHKHRPACHADEERNCSMSRHCENPPQRAEHRVQHAHVAQEADTKTSTSTARSSTTRPSFALPHPPTPCQDAQSRQPKHYVATSKWLPPTPCTADHPPAQTIHVSGSGAIPLTALGVVAGGPFLPSGSRKTLQPISFRLVVQLINLAHNTITRRLSTGMVQEITKPGNPSSSTIPASPKVKEAGSDEEKRPGFADWGPEEPGWETLK